MFWDKGSSGSSHGLVTGAELKMITAGKIYSERRQENFLSSWSGHDTGHGT